MTDIAEATRRINEAQAQLDLALAALSSTPPSLYAHACQDRTPRPKPPLPVLGPAGFTFDDPAFGTPMLRVTDAQLGGSSWRVPSNAHIAAWNADSTKFVLVGQTGTKVFAVDKPTWYRRRARVRVLSTQLPPPIDIKSYVEPCWSRHDPNVLYVVGGPIARTIQAVVFDGDVIMRTDDLLDLDTLGLHLDEPRTYVGGLVTSDHALMVFFGGEGQDKHCYVGLLPEGAHAFTVLLDTRTLGDFLLHSAAVDRPGEHLVLYPTNAQPYQTVFVDVTNDNLPTPVTVSPGGHDSIGYGWWVNADSGTQEWDAAQWQLRPISDLDARQDLITPVLRPKEIYLSEHSTWNNARADAPLLPVISVTFRFNNESAEWRAWDDEGIAIETTGPSTVYRFFQHRSDVRDESNSANNYFWYQPIANVSPDGRWVLFTSNWEKTLGLDPNDAGRFRQDVLLAQIVPHGTAFGFARIRRTLCRLLDYLFC